MNRAMIVGTFLITCILASLAADDASSQEAFLGDVKLTGVSFDQRGWVHCAGQELQIQRHTALFALLKTAYGGDGRRTFKLPDLRKAEAALRKAAGLKEDSSHLRYVICVQGQFPARD